MSIRTCSPRRGSTGPLLTAHRPRGAVTGVRVPERRGDETRAAPASDGVLDGVLDPATENKNSQALEVKLDELISATDSASNRPIDIGDLSERAGASARAVQAAGAESDPLASRS